MVSIKETRIKEREGGRLYRSLRRSFQKKFGFEWTNEETSYFNGKDIFVKYDMQVARTREFTEAELLGLRIGHGYHEAGHAEFDYLQDYIDWQKIYRATSKEEIERNEKYTIPILEFFGNFGLDGRMERLVKIKCPAQAVFIDFNNYEWRFGKRLENLGTSRYNDFRHAYGHRVLGMEDVEAWHPESVELLNTVSTEIKEIRYALTTKSCLEVVTTLIQKVWPTLLEWQKEDTSNDDRYEKNNHSVGRWSNSAKEAKEASQPLSEAELEEIASVKEEIEKGLERLQKQLNKDRKAIDEELKKEQPKNTNIKIQGRQNDPSSIYSENINVLPVSTADIAKYNVSLAKVRRYIKPVSKELRGILEGIPDQVQHNAKYGRLKTNQIWKATHCEVNNVFTRHIKGNPSKNAFIGVMTDVSGSTMCFLNDQMVISHMRDSITLLLEAATLASIPNIAYAFTEDYEDTYFTEIYQLKSDPDSFTNAHKAAIGGITPLQGNRDSLALQYLLNQVESRTENIRLAIMISDGIPNFHPLESPSTISEMVKRAQKNGIDVLCLFVGNEGADLDMAKIMYPGRVIHAEKNVAKQLQLHVKRIMRHRR